MKKILSEVTILEPVPIPSGLKSNFGEKRPDEIHPGVDIPVPVGTKVLAPMDGEVVVADFSFNPKCGATIDINYKNGFQSRFCHMSRIDVKQGDKVKQGQVVGLSGGRKGDPGAGRTTGPHLHFALKLNGKNVDALKYINSAVPQQSIQSVPSSQSSPESDTDEVMKIASELGIDTEKQGFAEFVSSLKPGQLKQLFQSHLFGPFMEEVTRIKQLIK